MVKFGMKKQHREIQFALDFIQWKHASDAT